MLVASEKELIGILFDVVMETIQGNQQKQLGGKHEYVEKWLSQISPQGDKSNTKLLYITEQNCDNDMENDRYPNKTSVDNSLSTDIISDSVQDPSYVPSESELSEVRNGESIYLVSQT